MNGILNYFEINTHQNKPIQFTCNRGIGIFRKSVEYYWMHQRDIITEVVGVYNPTKAISGYSNYIRFIESFSGKRGHKFIDAEVRFRIREDYLDTCYFIYTINNEEVKMNISDQLLLCTMDNSNLLTKFSDGNKYNLWTYNNVQVIIFKYDNRKDVILQLIFEED